MKPFMQLYHDIVKDPSKRFQGKLLSFDPGETTGWSYWVCTPDSVVLTESGQLVCKPFDQGIKECLDLIKRIQPNHIVYEDYRVYGFKTEQHAWAALHTPQLIGAIRTIAQVLGITTSTEMAQQAKAFVDDEKLEYWNWYIRGQKHARDAIRHALFYLIFRHQRIS